MKKHISLKGILTMVLLAVLALWSGAARAAGDYNAGAKKSFYCAYCHGYDGNPLEEKVPRLAGQKPEYLVARIKHLKDNRVMHQPMAQAFQTGELDERDIANLAAFYSRQPVRK